MVALLGWLRLLHPVLRGVVKRHGRAWRLTARQASIFAMSFPLRSIGRFAAQKLATDPRVRDSAVRAATVVVKEARQIAREQDRALAAGRAVRRAINKLEVGR